MVKDISEEMIASGPRMPFLPFLSLRYNIGVKGGQTNGFWKPKKEDGAKRTKVMYFRFEIDSPSHEGSQIQPFCSREGLRAWEAQFPATPESSGLQKHSKASGLLLNSEPTFYM